MPKRLVNGIVVKDEGIVDGDDLAPSMGASTFREWVQKMTNPTLSRGARLMLDGIVVSYDPMGPPLVARINHGRWLAQCECGGAEVVTPNDPISFCFSCYNADYGYHVRPVIFPQPSEIKAITATLMERKHQDMHWNPGETTEDLKGQNKALREMGKLRHQKE